MIYVDIDGTLTENGEKPNAKPILSRIEVLRSLSKRNVVVLWSGNGKDYAQWFAKKYNLYYCIPLGKPTLIVDDNPTIRPNWENLKRKPEWLGTI